MESDGQMSWNLCRKKTSVHFFVGCLIFSLVDLLLWVRGGGGGRKGSEGRSKVIIVFVWFFVSAGYQLLSGDGSRSRCMVALWCFMLSRYSC